MPTILKPKQAARPPRPNTCGRRSFPSYNPQGSILVPVEPSGLIYQRGLGHDWSAQTVSQDAGDEGDQHANGLLNYSPTGQIPQDLVAFSTLAHNNILGNTVRFEYQTGAGGHQVAVDHLTGKAWAVTHAIVTAAQSFIDAQTEIAARNAANYQGRNNWRTPTIRELMSVYVLEGGLDAFAHFSMNSGAYWSATTVRAIVTQNMVFSSGDASVGGADRDEDTAYLFMVCNELA